MPDVETHGFEDAFLGLFDGLAEAVDPGEILAVGVVALTFALDSDWIAVKSHCT